MIGRRSAWLLLLTGLVVLLVAVVVLTGCSSTQPTRPATGDPAGASPAGVDCHARGLLPDPVCTPGAVNPGVTQANIRRTICAAGWAATVRPPVSYTNRVKAASIMAYGYPDTDPHHYELDHLVPLEVGGAPTDPRNLWAEPGTVPNPKDTVEGRVHAAVCAGRMTLAAGQRLFMTDWTK